MSSIADIPVTLVAKESVILWSFFAVSCFTSCLTSGFSIGAGDVGGGDESMVLQNSCRVGEVVISALQGFHFEDFLKTLVKQTLCGFILFLKILIQT